LRSSQSFRLPYTDKAENLLLTAEANNTSHPPFVLAQDHFSRFPQKALIFSATVATTDNPLEASNKLMALIPASKAKHYQVRVEVVPVPDLPAL
jgi:hypothetical protein